MKPAFHFAFLVNDLETTRQFYGKYLGCKIGRSAPTWVDFSFFEHQLSAHLAVDVPPPKHFSEVDGKAVPVPHFGAILPAAEFADIAGRLRAGGVGFVIEPTVRFPGKVGEQRTMFFLDPSGNAIELKSFANPDDVFAS